MEVAPAGGGGFNITPYFTKAYFNFLVYHCCAYTICVTPPLPPWCVRILQLHNLHNRNTTNNQQPAGYNRLLLFLHRPLFVHQQQKMTKSTLKFVAVATLATAAPSNAGRNGSGLDLLKHVQDRDQRGESRMNGMPANHGFGEMHTSIHTSIVRLLWPVNVSFPTRSSTATCMYHTAGTIEPCVCCARWSGGGGGRVAVVLHGRPSLAQGEKKSLFDLLGSLT